MTNFFSNPTSDANEPKASLRPAATFAAVIFALTAATYSWLYAPYLKARLLLGTLDYHRGRNDDSLGPSMCGLRYWTFSFNTFTDDVETWCIESLYNQICRRLQGQFGEHSLSTYTYEDLEGYPRQVTVVRLREDLDSPSYLAVTALQNNDNDMVRFEHTRGAFDTTNKRPATSWTLPPSLLGH